MTQAELAEALGVAKRTVGRWEQGAAIPRSATGALLEVLHIPSVGDRPGDTDDDTKYDDDTIAGALRQASHLQVLAEVARRIQAAHEPGRELPDVPQVHLRWPRTAAPSARRDTGLETPHHPEEGQR